jgi:hypoxanthine phosphoribosyltransferase
MRQPGQRINHTDHSHPPARCVQLSKNVALSWATSWHVTVAVAPHSLDTGHTKCHSIDETHMPHDSNFAPSAALGEIEVIFPPDQIAKRIEVLASEIAQSQLDNLLVVAVLKGSFMFLADLVRALHRAGIAPEVEFMMLSSYRKSTKSSGVVEIVRDIETSVDGRNVLLIDDILESGRTLAFAKDLIAARGAKVIKTCVLLNKPIKRAVQVEADFKAFDCPELFVVGYGMDVGHRYRELPYVGHIMHT